MSLSVKTIRITLDEKLKDRLDELMDLYPGLKPAQVIRMIMFKYNENTVNDHSNIEEYSADKRISEFHENKKKGKVFKAKNANDLINQLDN